MKYKFKLYNSIPQWKKGHLNEPCLGFDKPDGNNMRFQWSRKRFEKGDKNFGWYKSGTRTQLIDNTHDTYGYAVDFFMSKYAEDLSKVFETEKYKKIAGFIVICEYFGDKSLGGKHYDEIADMKLVLIDVNPMKRGLINPFEFRDNFGHLDIPTIVYEGKYTEEVKNKVQNGEFGVFEGVVFKGYTKSRVQWMCKVKTRTWLELIRQKREKDIHLFQDDINAFDNE